MAEDLLITLENLRRYKEKNEAIYVGTDAPNDPKYLYWFDESSTPTKLRYKNANGDWREVGGSGGGSTSISAVAITADENVLNQTVSADDKCNISFEWSTTANNTSTGTVTLYVNSTKKYTGIHSQGEVILPVQDYLIVGKTNEIQVVVRDIFGMENTITFTVAVISINISSSFKHNTILAKELYPTNYSFPIIVKGGLNKTVHVVLDDTEIEESSIVVSAIDSGVQKYISIPSCNHGVHTLEIYATALLNGKTLPSNRLYYELIWTEEGKTDILIASQFTTKEADQYEVLSIPYYIYDPTTENPSVYFEVNSKRENEDALRINRTQQIWETSGDLVGENIFTIICGNTTKTFTVNLLEVETVDVEDVKDELQVCLIADKTHNNTIVETRDVWKSSGIYPNLQVEFNNFNWITDGWTTNNGSPALNISGGASLYIPYSVFAGSYKTEDGNTVDTDFKTVGGTFEIEFKVSEVINIDTPFLTCMSNGRGIEITPQRAMLKSLGTEVETKFKEGDKNSKDDKMRVSFVVTPENQGIIYIYINGIASGAMTYESTDSFKQEIDPVGITITSTDCSVDLFSIRIYRSALTAGQIRNNWIYDMANIGEQVNAYKRNDIYDLTSGEILYSKLVEKIPCMTITGTTPAYKGDKRIVDIQFEGTEDRLFDFTLNSAQIDVQGTSSQYYPLKNWKFKSEYKVKNSSGNEVKIVQKFITNSGESFTYALGEGLLGDKTFCLKADYMETSSTHNTVTANIANGMYTVQTPVQSADETGMTRTTIYGRPIVVFYKETEDSPRIFGGKFNFNYDKDSEGVFGFIEDEDYEVIECFEFCNNTSDRCLLHKSEYINKIEAPNAEDYEDYIDINGQIPEWRTDFETRYCYRSSSNTKPDYAYLKAVTDWLVSVDQTQATGVALSEPYVTDRGAATYLYDENANIVTFIDANNFIRKAIDIGIDGIEYSYEIHQITETDEDGNEVIVEYYALPIDDSGNEVYSFTHDTVTYRLSKFKTELEEHFNTHFVLMYYLLTDVLGMIDSRTKNMFWATWGERHDEHLDSVNDNNVIWYPIFYDMDTMMGLSNAGKMDIPYNVEYDTKLENSDVGYAYNGASNVLWNNVEDAFSTELKALYKEKCSDGTFTYKSFIDAYEGHSDNWCESIYNEDAQRKYVIPFTEGYFGYTEDSTDEMVTTYPDYLYVVQGNRKYHRRWWLDNRFNFVNSKYGVNSYMSDYITMRLYTPENVAVEPNADFTITTCSDQYVRIKYGSKTNYGICTHNVPTVIEAPNDTFNDTETIIYGASRIISVGDLSDKYARSIDLSKASKLTEAIIGSDVEGYSNSTLDSINITSNPMLQKIYVQNCPNLTGTLNVSNCPIIKEILAHGTAISMLSIPEGGILEKVTLPNTMLNLNIINHTNLNDFTLAKRDVKICPNCGEIYNIDGVECTKCNRDLSKIEIDSIYNLETIRIEDTPIDTCSLVENSPKLTRLRLVGIDWHLDDDTVLYHIKNNIKGFNANGGDQDKPVLMGDCEVLNIKDYLKDDIDSYFNGGVSVENLPEISQRDFRLRAKNIIKTHLVHFYDSINEEPLYSGITDNRVLTKGFAHYEGETPTKQEDWAKTYEFDSWGIYVDGELRPISDLASYPITENTDFYAIYKETKKLFIFNFYRQNAITGYYELHKSESITFDNVVIAETFPDEFANDDYALRFKGWSTSSGVDTAEINGGAVIAVTEESPYIQDFYTVYTIDYKYRITFVDYNDEIIKDTVIYYTGDTVNVPENLVRDPDIQYVYTFSGWSLDGETLVDISAVGGKNYTLIYKAMYTSELRPYFIKFIDWDGKPIDEQTVRYGQLPIEPDNPTREDTAQYDYEFDRWVPDITAVTGEAVYTAKYSEKVRKYTVTWKNEDGTVLETDITEYGLTPSYDGATPTIPATAQYTYTFADWHIQISEVVGDITYIATYTKDVNKYTVTWKDCDGNVIKTETKVPYGDVPKYDGTPPAKPATKEYYYQFLGWDADVTEEVETDPIMVTGNVVYTPVYTEHKQTYTITFLNYDGSVIKSEVLEYGSMPIAPTPSRTGYDFTGWDSSVTTVTGDKTYTAQYEIKTFTITWKVGDNTTTQTYDYNSTPKYPNGTPILAGVLFPEANVFKGWSPNIATVTDNATYTAQFQLEGITGNCGADGDNVQWLILNGTLYVRGSGATVSLGLGDSSLWKNYLGQFDTIIVGGGVALKGRLFKSLKSIKKVSFSSDTVPGTGMLFNETTGDMHIEIPEGWTTIDSMFYGCKGLTNIIIPVSVKLVEDTTFYNASNLENVYYRGSSTDWGNITIGINNNPFKNATRHYNFTGTLDDIIDA